MDTPKRSITLPHERGSAKRAFPRGKQSFYRGLCTSMLAGGRVSTLGVVFQGSEQIPRRKHSGNRLPFLQPTWHLWGGTWKTNFLLKGPRVRCHVSGNKGNLYRGLLIKHGWEHADGRGLACLAIDPGNGALRADHA